MLIKVVQIFDAKVVLIFDAKVMQIFDVKWCKYLLIKLRQIIFAHSF